jgi:hypothetical protein
MLQLRDFNHIFRIFCTRNQYRVESKFSTRNSIPIVRSLAERVLVSRDFLTVPRFSGFLKIKSMPRSRRTLCLSSYEKASVVCTTNLHKNITEELFLPQGTSPFQR